MPYFSKLPKLLYSTSRGIVNPKIVTNIFAKTKFLGDVFNNTSLYYKYAVKDGERPEDIAYKLYKDVNKHWIILMANDCIDPKYDWPLSSNDFDKYVKQKYSTINLALSTAESYPTNYSIGELVYQGPNLSDSSVQGEVIGFDTTNKILTVKFVNDVFANSVNVTGATSNVTHTVTSITLNNDGFQWASNTVRHYAVTEISVNSFDNISTTNKYLVSANDFNHASNTVINRNINTTLTNTYALENSVTLTVTTTVAPVTHYDYEYDVNETKRFIKVPKKEYVGRIEEQFSGLMRR